MRISGLASGFDTEKMVSDLMKAHRIPLDKISQKKQYLEWQLNDYRSTNRKLFDFSQSTFSNMILSTSFSAKTVSVSSPDDVGIRNMGSTSDFSGSIKIQQLAKNATLQGGSSIKFIEHEIGEPKVKVMQSENTKLSQLGITGKEIIINAPDKNGNMPTEPVKITFDPEKDSLNSVLSEINKLTGVSAFFDSHTGKIAMTAKNSGEGNIEVTGDLGMELGLVKSTISFPSIESTTAGEMKVAISRTDGTKVNLVINSTETSQDVLERLNESSTGLNATYNETTKKFTIIVKDNNVGDVAVTNNTGGTFGSSNSTAGQNAIFNLNGLETERSSNTFQINGFEFNLKQVTADGAAPITFSSAPDTNKIFDSVVKFVDEYNKLIEDLNKQIREPKYRDFQPLSAEQKKDMKEKDIEQWEEKAKSGTLRNDSTISSMLTQMRTALMGTVGGELLESLGITTSKDYTANGKLVIDETKLKKAISDDPNKVHELFSKDGTTVAEQGFARKLRTIVDNTQKSIADRAGKVGSVNDSFSLGRSLKDMNSQIERFEGRLKMMESRYWKQFSAMETAINRANSQSTSLMNAFSNN